MIDVTTPSLYLEGIPYHRFASLREQRGLAWHPYETNGFWAVTRHEDVHEVSRNPEIYSSAIGNTNLWDLEADALVARRSLIDTDSPEHTQLRRIVNQAFTPRNVKLWEPLIRTTVERLIDRFIRRDGGDWVKLVAAPLPIQVILTILGVPLEDADHLTELSDYLVEGTTDRPPLPDSAFGNKTALRLLPFGSPASHAIFEYAQELGDKRRVEPESDLVTQLVLSEVDGKRLSNSEFRNFFHLLMFAGNETTRTAISHGALALANHPEEWHRLTKEPSVVSSATEEILRWATPVLHMRRTAASDTELAGTAIAAGDKVVMWYAAANRDDRVFEEPEEFRVCRDPNPHFAFGGGGAHFCLGAHLARLEIRTLLEEMLRRGLGLVKVSEPVRIPSNFVHGIESLYLGIELNRSET